MRLLGIRRAWLVWAGCLGLVLVAFVLRLRLQAPEVPLGRKSPRDQGRDPDVVRILRPVPAVEPRPIPELYVPNGDNDELPSGAIRRLGATTFLHAGIGLANFSKAEPFFSPDGETVYVAGNFGLMAFETATGRMRFHYRYSLLNVRVVDEGAAGVRVDFDQGPLQGQFVLLEHTTGKELSRGSQSKLTDFHVIREFAEGQRAFASKMVGGDPRNGPSHDCRFVLFDVPNAKTLTEISSQITNRSHALSPDCRYLAIVPDEMELRVFDTRDGRLLRTLPLYLKKDSGDHADPVWSSDGKTVYISRLQPDAAEVVGLEIATGEVRVLFRVPRKYIQRTVTVSPDGQYMAYRHTDDPREQASYWKILRQADGSEVTAVDIRPIHTLATFSPDSRSLWLLSNSGLARFDLATGKLDPLSANPLAPIEALAFSADGKQLRGVAGAEVITWDVTTGQEILPRAGFDDFIKTASMMRCIQLSADGKQSVWAGRRGKSQIHSVIEGRKVAEFYAANMTLSREFVLTADQQRIVHDANFGALKVGDLWSGKTVHELLPKRIPRENYNLAVAPDNRTLAVLDRDYKNRSETEEADIDLWDIQRGIRMGKVRQVVGPLMMMQFSQDSRELRVWHNQTLSRWDVAGQTLIHRTVFAGVWYPFQSSPNRHWHLGKSYRQGDFGHIELRDVLTAGLARIWTYPSQHIKSTAFSRDGRLLAVSCEGTPVFLYDFYECRPESIGLRDQTVAHLVDLLAVHEVSKSFEAMCELIRRGDSIVPSLKSVAGQNREMAGRVCEILEAIGTPAARALLSELAKGEDSHLATHEARATMARINPQ